MTIFATTTSPVAPGRTRTYIASLGTPPDLTAAAAGATSRGERKLLAAGAMRDATTQAAGRVMPQLDAMRGAGLLTGVEVLPFVGAALIHVPDDRAADAWSTLRQVDGLHDLRRDRTMQVIAPPGTGHVEGLGDDAPTPNVARVNAPAAWQMGATGQGVVVGSIDTGVTVAHEALRIRYRGLQPDGSLRHDYGFFDFVDRLPEPTDPREHGTHTVGTIVGGAPGRQVGVAPGATFIAARAIGPMGKTKQSDLLAALNWMIAPTDAAGANPDPARAPDVVNNSWGYPEQGTPFFRNAVQAMAAGGIVPVFAAGNEGPKERSMRAPGTYPETIAVAATDDADAAASFSSRGPGPFTNPDGTPVQKPDVAAPGVNVTSTSSKAVDQYREMSGTSMAAPNVAGVVALLLSRHPNLTVAQVRESLTASARDLGAPGPDTTFGHGRVDAAAALAYADSHFGTPPASRPASGHALHR